MNGTQKLKARLRREVLARRDALPPALRRELSARLFAHVADLPAYRSAETVLAYASFGSEPETGPFLDATLGAGKRLLLPRVDRGRLALHEVEDRKELVPGRWGIPEPPPELPEVGAGEADFVLVPGVAFDARGGRLGYGAGFYDGLLGGLPERPPLVAGAFAVQVVEKVPTEAHDVIVGSVVTEAGPLTY